MNDRHTKIADPEYYYGKAKSKTDWHRGDLKRSADFIKEKFLSGEVKRILEVGCGMAELLEHIPKEVDYYGLDPAEVCVESDTKKYPGAIFKIGFAEEIPFPSNSFDLVFSHQVLEMLQDPRKGLKEMMRVINPRGYIMMIAPNLESPWATIHSIRAYSFMSKTIFIFKRFWDLFLRTLGILKFRVIESHMQATGKFEKSDDDLKYITSSYEVATFFKRHGFIEVARKEIHYPSNSLKNFLKGMMIKIPIFRYYNSGMFFIFKKI